MGDNEIWAVVPGAIRRPIEFKFSILELLRLREAGLLSGVVLTTWEGEIDRVDGLRDQLVRNSVVTVETTPPKDLGSWNIFGQHWAFLQGLNAIPTRDAYVFKSRTDRSFELTWSYQYVMQRILSNPILWDDRNIYCSNFSSTLPFFISDFIFLMHIDDCYKVFNMDYFFEHNVVHPQVPELCWFTPLILGECPIMRQFLQIVPNVDLSASLMRALLANPDRPLPTVVSELIGKSLTFVLGRSRTTLDYSPERGDATWNALDLFSFPKKTLPGVETMAGYSWSVLRDSGLMQDFRQGRCTVPVSLRDLQEILHQEITFGPMETVSSKQLDIIDDFIAEFYPQGRRCARPGWVRPASVIHGLRGQGAVDDFGISSWIGGGETGSKLLEEFRRFAGSNGISAALHKVSQMTEVTADLATRMLLASAESDNIDAYLELARTRKYISGPNSYEERVELLERAERAVLKACPWRLPEVLAVKASIEL